jgi:hypothetical protein
VSAVNATEPIEVLDGDTASQLDASPVLRDVGVNVLSHVVLIGWSVMVLVPFAGAARLAEDVT